MSDGDAPLAAKRVHADRGDRTLVYVASELGLTRVAVSDDQIGRFDLARQCDARDVAGGDGRLVLATDEDVLVGTGDGFAATGFGPGVAVGVGEGILAAGPDGAVARLVDDRWVRVGTVPDAVAADGDLVAGPDRVYRVPTVDRAVESNGGSAEESEDGGGDENGEGSDEGSSAKGQFPNEAGDLAPVGDGRGLGGLQDVAAAGPYVASERGVFRCRDGRWEPRLGDAASAVTAAPDGRAHAVVDGGLRERTADGWRPVETPRDGVVDVAYGSGRVANGAQDGATVAVTGDGDLLLDAPSAKDGHAGWRSRALGVPDVRAVAVP